jgi:hypothetical protein
MKPYRFRNCSASFLGLALVVGMLLVVGCGGGGGGGTPAAPVAPGSPILALSAASIPFPNTVLGQTAVRQVTVQNTGNANLVIGQITPMAAPFTLADACSGQTVSPNGTCDVGISFTPGVQDTFSGTFTIPSNAGNPTVSVSGNGQGLNVTITDVDTTSTPGSVKLLISVTDADNNPIPNLLIGSFTLFEQGSEILNPGFSNVIVRPVSVALDLDFSNSVNADLPNIRTSAKDFLSNLNEATDEAAVIKFARTVETTVPLTSLLGNLPDFNLAIDAAYTGDRTATRFFDSVFGSVNILGLSGVNGNISAVVAVSDGHDEEGASPSPEDPPVLLGRPVSTENLDSVIEHAQNNKVAIYTIGFGPRIVYNVVQRLADETGGLFLETPNSAGLQQAYQRIAEVFANLYELTFTSGVAGTVNLTVEVVDGLLLGDDTVEVTY